MCRTNVISLFAVCPMLMAMAAPPAIETARAPAQDQLPAQANAHGDRVAWLKEHAIALQSIDPDDVDDFSDLQPLKKLIGDSRVVALGEQSHGDGAVFYAKGRLIKFLHQEMGFDVLAWESGMFDCREVDRAIKDKSVPMDDVCKRGIFAIWTFSAQVRPVLDYVRATHETDHPLEIAGFDEQLSSRVPSRWPEAMRQFLEAAGPEVMSDELRQSLTNDFLAKPRDDMKPQEILERRERWSGIPALIDANREKLIAVHGEREFAFMRRTADDVLVFFADWAKQLEPTHEFTAADNNSRDRRMGENLAWLANERFKGRKIIVWEATFHALHDPMALKSLDGTDAYDALKTCGQTARESLGQSLYTIGFTAWDGQAGNVLRDGEPHQLAKPSDGSIEELFHATGKPFLFVDFRSLPADHWLRQPLIARPLGYDEMRGDWTGQMDAMIYIQTMFPSTRSNTLPEYAKVRANQP